MVGSKKNYKFELGVEGLNHSLCDQWKQNHLAKSHINYCCHYWVFASKHYSTMWKLSFLSHLLMKADSLLIDSSNKTWKHFCPTQTRLKLPTPPLPPDHRQQSNACGLHRHLGGRMLKLQIGWQVVNHCMLAILSMHSKQFWSITRIKKRHKQGEIVWR